jgi:hypothetical protein
MERVGRLIVLLCLAVLLFTALHPDTSPDLLTALVPEWFLFAILLAAVIHRRAEDPTVPLTPSLLVLLSRAPPLS